MNNRSSFLDGREEQRKGMIQLGATAKTLSVVLYEALTTTILPFAMVRCRGSISMVRCHGSCSMAMLFDELLD